MVEAGQFDWSSRQSALRHHRRRVPRGLFRRARRRRAQGRLRRDRRAAGRRFSFPSTASPASRRRLPPPRGRAPDGAILGRDARLCPQVRGPAQRLARRHCARSRAPAEYVCSRRHGRLRRRLAASAGAGTSQSASQSTACREATSARRRVSRPRARGRSSLEIDRGECIGCGACVGACPVGVFRMDGASACVQQGAALALHRRLAVPSRLPGRRHKGRRGRGRK